MRKAVMIAHAAYPRLDLQEKDKSGKLLPASLSRISSQPLLRDDLDFNGVVISDDLEMESDRKKLRHWRRL